MPDDAAGRVDIFLNPLLFHAAEAIIESGEGELSSEQILRHLCSINLKSDPRSFLERYSEIRQLNTRALFATPVSPEILNQFVFPLRDAFCAYLLGSYISAIANCGYVAEMIAVLKHRIANRTVNGAPSSKAVEKKFYGKPFENLGQERRVEVLNAWGILPEKSKVAFAEIRRIRRKYLHFGDDPENDVRADAVLCLKHAEFLLIWLMGLTIVNGSLAFGPDFREYLKAESLISGTE